MAFEGSGLDPREIEKFLPRYFLLLSLYVLLYGFGFPAIKYYSSTPLPAASSVSLQLWRALRMDNLAEISIFSFFFIF